MAIARVFPRRTSCTPDDALAFVGEPPIDPPPVDEVHISVAFTYDIKRAFDLAGLWVNVAPVTIGGPAFNLPSSEFTPGLYVKHGITITSRGCPNRCWFCSVWRREPKLIELSIRDGWIVHDDNLLACSEKHIRAVFEMLERQPHKAEFRGGIEAARLQQWHVDLLRDSKPSAMFFAYDMSDDRDALERAAKMLTPTFTRHQLYAYVLIGYPKDTMEEAVERLEFVRSLSICPFAMLWKDAEGHEDKAWRRLQRSWCRPAMIYAKQQGRF